MLGVRNLHHRIHVALARRGGGPRLLPLLHLLFPPACAACGAPLSLGASTHLCPGCRDQVRPYPRYRCPICGEPFFGRGGDGDHLCGRCLNHPPPYRRGVYPLEYGGVVRRLIHLIKYHGDRYALKALVELIPSEMRKELAADRVMVPVPLHPRRLRERGFNQAQLMARAIFPGAPVDAALLRRVKETPSQTGLGRRGREANVRGAFRADVARARGAKRVLLVDDVATTSATLTAAATALARAGVRDIVVFASARTPFRV